ncbi:MAG: FGGY-family carbohydrate kinase, partial [Oscillospiraceae bacterium]
FKLTGEFATEVSDASGMQLLDIASRCWSDEVLNKLDIDKNLLPKVYESPEVTGRITTEIATLTGLKEGTIVVGGAGDNAAAAVGTGVVEDNKAFTTIGTSGVLFAHTSKMQIDKKGRVHTFCSAVPNEWHVMGVTQAAGLSMKWLRDTLCQTEMEEAQKQGVDSYILLDKMAKDVQIGANKLLYLPYLMGERTPHLDLNARGVLFGLCASHTKADIIRAVLEGVAYSLRDCIEILREMDVYTDDMMICGGGAKSPIWRQMLADLYGCEVKILSSNEGAALGSAILAFVGAGEFETVQSACKAIVKTADCYPPIKQNSNKYNQFYNVYQSLYLKLKDSYQMLANI